MPSSERQIRPAYDFLADKRRFTLGRAKVRVTIGNDPFEGEGRGVLQVSPEPSVLLIADIPDVPFQIVMEAAFADSAVSHFEFGGKAISGFGGFTGRVGGESNELVWHPSAEPVQVVGGESTSIRYVIFHLFNFRDFTNLTGLSEERDGTAVAINKLSLKHSNLTVVCSKRRKFCDDLKRKVGAV